MRLHFSWIVVSAWEADCFVTPPPFAIGKPFVRSPRGDSRATPEEKLRAKAQRAAEAAERRAKFLTNLTAHQPQIYS